jgi:hypothetical protein
LTRFAIPAGLTVPGEPRFLPAGWARQRCATPAGAALHAVTFIAGTARLSKNPVSRPFSGQFVVGDPFGRQKHPIFRHFPDIPSLVFAENAVK